MRRWFNPIVLVSPSDHFVLHETVANDAGELRSFIDEVVRIAAATDCDVFWRGQADHRWAISSSLARVGQPASGLKDTDLSKAERALLQDARSWVTASTIAPDNDLEWLALLQHHGVPTRLMDFTKNPFIATFFAVEALDDVEGRLVAIAVPRTPSRLIEDPDDFDFASLRLGELRVWEPSRGISPRLVAQEGVFAIGRLPSTYPARHVKDPAVESGDRLMTRSEVVSVLSLPLYLVTTARGANRRSVNHPSCFTAKIHVDKASLREQLAKRTPRGALRPTGSPINHASCYPDVDGMRTYSRVLEQVRRGIL